MLNPLHLVRSLSSAHRRKPRRRLKQHDPANMPMPALTLRNLTPLGLHLSTTQLFAPPPPPPPEPISRSNVTSVSNLAHNLTHALHKTPLSPVLSTPPPSYIVPHDAHPKHESKYNWNLGRFEQAETPIALPADEILRIEFDLQGKRFRVDVPPFVDEKGYAQLEVHSRFNDVGDTRLTAVYHRHRAHLVLFSCADLANWMAHQKDATNLSALSLPGTHNSPTHHTALPSVRCQAVSVQHQLEHGVRFLDIRLQVCSDKSLELVHGAFPIALPPARKMFRDLAQTLYRFLDAHPRETIIVSLKREGRGDATDEEFSELLHKNFIQKDAHYWSTTSTLPTLGSIRGKLVLFRRYKLAASLPAEYGLNAEHWDYNTPCDTSALLSVQDFCEVLATENIDKKIHYIKEQLERSCAAVCACKHEDGEQYHGPLYVNFLSASNFWKPGCWPEGVARKVNPEVVEALCCDAKVEKGTGRTGTGVVVMDYVGEEGDWSATGVLVGLNAGLAEESG